MIDLTRIPGLSNFQRTHIGTTVTGLSGILPFQKKTFVPALKPITMPKLPIPRRWPFTHRF